MFHPARPRLRRGLAVGAVVLSTCLVASCASQEPAPPSDPERHGLLTIAISPNSYEQVILGEIYKQVMQKSDRDTTMIMVDPKQGPMVDTLIHTNADVIIGCAGSILEELNPTRAEELRAHYADKDRTAPTVQAELREDTYKSMVGSLSNGLDAADPSNGSGCAEDSTDLAQNFVPVFLSDHATRETRLSLNIASGALRTDEIKKLVQRAQGGESARKLAADYISSKGIE